MMLKPAKIFEIGITAFLLGMVASLLSCANTSQGPLGGPKDTIPPVLIKVVPNQPIVNFKTEKGSILLNFNEYVQLKNPYQQILLSPPTTKKPKSKIKKKGILVSFEDTLKTNQTYTLHFGTAISDVNEGNPFHNFAINFSTGDNIDSLIISGTVMDYTTLLPKAGVLVSLYHNPSDSSVLNTLPDAISSTDEWGYFCVRGLKGIPYTIYAFEDKNNNYLYDRGVEFVGFCDTTITATIVGKEDLPQMAMMDMKDTIACLSRPSETDIYIFKEKVTNQYIENIGRINERECFIKFHAENPQIDTFRIKGIFTDRIIKQFNSNRDSLTFWINEQKPVDDTLYLRINYMKTDSTGKLVPCGETRKLVKPFDKSKIKQTNSNNTDSENSGLTNAYLQNLSGNTDRNTDRNKPTTTANKSQEKNNLTDKNTKTREDLLTFSLNVDGKTVENMGIELVFPTPLIQAPKDSISFTSTTPRMISSAVDFSMDRDTANILRYIIRAKEGYKVGNQYTIKIPTGAFKDINGFTNDSLVKTFALPTDDKLSSITLEISGVDNCKYIVELVNEKRDKVFLRHEITKDGNILFPYLNAGFYSFRITQDINGNGRLDVGDVILRIPPEKARLFKFPDGKVIIDLKEQTDLTQSVDLVKLFK